MRKPEATKTAILDAAKRILTENGALVLTIDEVAKAASVSKGGVLHYYPNKEALILKLLQRELDRFDADVEHLQRQDPAAPGAYTRAFLRACVDEYVRGASHAAISGLEFRNIRATQVLAQAYINRWQQRVEGDGLDPVVATLVRFASGGIWLSARVNSDKPATFKAVVQKLRQFAGAPAPSKKRARKPAKHVSL